MRQSKLVSKLVLLWLPILVILVGVLVLPVSVPTTRAASTQPHATALRTIGLAVAPGIAVGGHHLVLASNPSVIVHLRGVNRSGTEYACIQGWGYGEGPYDQGEINSILSWHANAVRVPLNEDCWLGINMGTSKYGGAAYRSFVEKYIGLLLANGLTPILDLHWNAPGTQRATGQQVMADNDHSPAFWKSVTAVYGKDNRIIFDLYNEPHDISWFCWKNGGPGCSSFVLAGMNTLINAVRGAGGINVLMAGGLAWANDLSGWLSHFPYDPRGQLAASYHTYNCTNCQNTIEQNVAGHVPVVAGEIGETDGGYVSIIGAAQWQDSMNQGYLGWDWSKSACPCLVTSQEYGTPNGAYGQHYHDYLISKQ